MRYWYIETNEDKTFVKSPKKIAIRLSVLLFVVIVGSIFPRFKDIISFDILLIYDYDMNIDFLNECTG